MELTKFIVRVRSGRSSLLGDDDFRLGRFADVRWTIVYGMMP